MKRVIALLLVFASVQITANAAPTDTLPKWSIGIIAVGNYQSMYQGFQPQFLPGIQVNRKLGKYELRLGIEHTVYAGGRRFGQDYFGGLGNHTSNTLRIGIERGYFITRKLKVYGALDLAARYQKGNYESFGCFGPLGIVNYTTRSVGVMPTLGLNYQISKRISVFAEYRAEFFVTDVTEHIIYPQGNIDTRPYHYNNFDFNFGTIGQVGIKIAL
jgi:hypothetical protein